METFIEVLTSVYCFAMVILVIYLLTNIRKYKNKISTIEKDLAFAQRENYNLRNEVSQQKAIIERAEANRKRIVSDNNDSFTKNQNLLDEINRLKSREIRFYSSPLKENSKPINKGTVILSLSEGKIKKAYVNKYQNGKRNKINVLPTIL